MKAIEQLETRMTWGRNLTGEDMRLFAMIRRLYITAREVAIDMIDVGLDINEKTGHQWSCFTELNEALDDVEKGIVQYRKVTVNVETTLSDEELKTEVAKAINDLPNVDKPCVKVELEDKT